MAIKAKTCICFQPVCFFYSSRKRIGCGFCGSTPVGYQKSINRVLKKNVYNGKEQVKSTKSASNPFPRTLGSSGFCSFRLWFTDLLMTLVHHGLDLRICTVNSTFCWWFQQPSVRNLSWFSFGVPISPTTGGLDVFGSDNVWTAQLLAPFQPTPKKAPRKLTPMGLWVG